MGPKAAPKPAAKKGPPAAMLAKIKAALDAAKDEEKRLQREADEAERKRVEEEKIAEEERKREEEQKKLVREEHKVAAKDHMKDRKKHDQLLALERMRAAGMIIPDKATAPAAPTPAAQPPKPPRPAPKKQHADPVPAPVESGPVDDWESLADVAPAAASPSAEATSPPHTAGAASPPSSAAAADGSLEFVTNLRSPILCVLGHVDAGKTSLLDRIRRTNVQGGEAGGITQQIGATFFPREAIVAKTAELNEKYHYNLKVPGLLVIDTPGHESFTNLRSRGSSLCDISILVVDITHGLQPQTRESLRLLRERKCPFVVALNKVDRLLDWEPHENMDIEQALTYQKPHVIGEYETRVASTLLQFAEEGFNAALYYKNPDIRKYISVVPTSSRTGEGISDLLLLMIQLVQRFMENKVEFRDALQCTVLEVKPIAGFGTTIDVVLVNGTLHEGDKIVVCGLAGAIVTTIRALLTPHPMKEMRIKGDYHHHTSIRAAMGVKIAANDLEQAVPGTPLLVCKPGDDQEKLCEEVMKDLNSLLSSVSKHGAGVAVQSSTLGALEALLCFLRDMKIPVSAIALGPVHKRHVIPVLGMKERSPKYAVMLAFDVPVTREAQDMATKNNVPIFQAPVIYHLFDAFTKYVADFDAAVVERNRAIAVFPVQLTGLQGLRNRDPLIIGCLVQRGQLHIGTPLAVFENGVKVNIGRVVDIQKDQKEMKVAKRGEDCAVKISAAETNTQFGRQLTEESTLYAIVTRESIDALKESFRADMDDDDWRLVIELKKLNHVI